MKQLIDKYYVWSFVAMMVVVPLLLFAIPKQSFSDTENRSLQKLPQLSWEAIRNKQFMDEADAYVSDHFPFRQYWVASKSTLEQLRLQVELNGIIKGHDGYLFERFTEPDYTKLEQYMTAINHYALNHPEANVTFMLAPNSIGIYEEYLPWLVPNDSQQVVNSWVAEQTDQSITFLNGFDFLSPNKNDELALYYKTDHHWTTYGAFLAYQAYANSLGWLPAQLEDFTIKQVSSSFLGSYHTKSLFSRLKADNIDIFEPKTPLNTEFYVADTDETFATLYDEQALTKKDQYAYFLGGVHALMTLTTTHEQDKTVKDKLLVIKDSYAHNMLPFLTQHVAEIHVIDLRYYNGNISEYMTSNSIDEVLMLFNTTTFVEEQNLLKLKY